MLIKKKHMRLITNILNLFGSNIEPESLDGISIGDLIRLISTKHDSLFIPILILKKSQEYVPVDTGALRDSAKIMELGDNKYKIIYDIPYAAIQHEDIDFKHIPPGRAKYLEDAAYEILNIVGGKTPLFTFNMEFPGDGSVALNINSISSTEFISNKDKRDRLLNISTLELWDIL